MHKGPPRQAGFQGAQWQAREKTFWWKETIPRCCLESLAPRVM